MRGSWRDEGATEGVKMYKTHNPALVANAKALRRNMTKEERHLWYDFLRTHSAKFQRQKVLGNYIADFYCAKHHLVIELDGSQHFEPSGQLRDEKRTDALTALGVRVLRFANNEINHNFEGVCEYINMVLNGSAAADREA